MADEDSPDKVLANLLASVSEARRMRMQPAESEPATKSSGSVLTKEEKSFFFGTPKRGSDVEVSVLEDNQAVYEELLLAPSGREARRMHAMQFAALGLLLLLIAVLCYQQFGLRRDLAELQLSLLQFRQAQTAPKETSEFSELMQLSWQEQLEKLGARLDSPMVTRQEQAEIHFMLATFAFAEGLYSEGRQYLVEGVRLRDAK